MSLLLSPSLSTFAVHACLLALKMFVVALLTGKERLSRGIFVNPEDASSHSKKTKVVTDDPRVERLRRVHRNDLENILPFFILAPLFIIITQPSDMVAVNLIRVFSLSRIAHSLVYILTVPQPSRALAYIVAMGINVYMALAVIWASLDAI